jgi:hypothetical protein
MFLENVKEEIRFTPRFFYGKTFTALCAVLTYVFWIAELNYIGFLLFFALLALIFVLCRDASPSLTVITLMLFTPTTQNFAATEIALVASGFALFAAGIIVHFLRFGADFSFLKPKNIKPVTLSMLVILPAVALGGVTRGGRDILVYLAVVATFVVLSAVYVVFYASCAGGKGAPILDAVVRSAVAMGGLLCAQMLTIAIKCGNVPNILFAVEHRLFSLTWMHANNIAALLSVAIPVTLYCAAKSKKAPEIYIGLAVLEFCVMVLTGSRGALAITACALPIVAIVLAVKAQNKKRVLIDFAVVVVLGGIVAGVFFDRLKEMFSRFLELGFSDNGRFEIYEFAIENFKAWPIFGAGMDYAFGTFGKWQVFWYHSTFFQILACFGILGVLAFGYF